MNFFKGNFKFIIILILIFFGGAIINIVDNFDYNENKTGIIYQENENIVLSELNKTYDYNINYNLSQSYLHYFPVKKNGLVDNYYKDKSKNLAVPDLTGKEYLGHGVYRLYNEDGIILVYNEFNGVYTLNGTVNTGQNIRVPMGNVSNWEQGETYTTSLKGLSINSYVGSSNFDSFVINTGGPYSPYWSGSLRNALVNGDTVVNSLSNQDNNSFQMRLSKPNNSPITFNDWEFTLQIEKGSQATDYQVPVYYLPLFKIDFKGSNQVEYINPFEEQIIKINDINNVNNIEFDLLNTINPVVFNWNITTNPNIPFVKFYNNKTKLLYDFTDINEINYIGNELLGSRSNFSVVFGGVFELIDMFYSGFQKLFNNSLIRNIFDNLKTVPSIVGNWFWFKGGIN